MRISPKEIGQRLKLIRQNLNLKQKDLAQKLGISANYLSELESGKKKPSKFLIEIFKNRLAINPDWLLTGQGEMFIKPTDKEDEVLSPELIEALKSHPTIEKIVLLLKDMDDSKIQEIFNLVQEKKLLMELLKERYKQTA